MKQLIEDLISAIEYHVEQTRPIHSTTIALQAAREYLQKPTQQEPVAWGVFDHNLHDMFFAKEEAHEMVCLKGDGSTVKPLYATPPQRTWVGLTLDDIPDDDTNNLDFYRGGRWAERVLKEKNDV